MTDLSKDFTLEEMYASGKAAQLHLDNTPDAEITAHLKELVTNILQPFRNHLGLAIKVNSGYRSPAVNTAIGGATYSAHRYGYAADILCMGFKGGSPYQLALELKKFLDTNKIGYDQLIYEFVGGAHWVHIAVCNRFGAQRKQVLTIRNKSTYVGIVDLK